MSVTTTVSWRSSGDTAEPAVVSDQWRKVRSLALMRFFREEKCASISESSSSAWAGREERKAARCSMVAVMCSGSWATNTPPSMETPSCFKRPTPGPASCRSNAVCRPCMVGDWSASAFIHVQIRCSSRPFSWASSPARSRLISRKTCSSTLTYPWICNPCPAPTAMA